jgi:cytochrome bd-type quinol oxidase subunit 2
MNQSAFYGVVAATNLTLLGLWWVAVKDRTNLIGHKDAASRRAAYLVSLQFAIPATVALLAQVNPGEPAIWRFAFGSAGVIGAIGIALLARQIWSDTVARVAPILFALFGIPAYVLVVIVAFFPTMVADAGLTLKPIEAEGMLFSALLFLGVQEAWVVSMTPTDEAETEVEVEIP